MYPVRVFALHSSSSRSKGRDTPASHGALAADRLSGAPPREHAMPPRPALLGSVLAARLDPGERLHHLQRRPGPGRRAAPVPVRSAPVERGTVAAPVRAAGTVHPKDERRSGLQGGRGGGARRGRARATGCAAGRCWPSWTPPRWRPGRSRRGRGWPRPSATATRARTLAAQDVVPRALAEDAETAARVARAGLAAAEFNLRRAVLTAPDDGWVEERLVEPGEVVAPGRPVLRVSGRATRGSWCAPASPIATCSACARASRRRSPSTRCPARRSPGPSRRSPGAPRRATGTYEVEVSSPRPTRGAAWTCWVASPPRWRSTGRWRSPAAVPIAALVDADGARAAVFALEAGHGPAACRSASPASRASGRCWPSRCRAWPRSMTDGAAQPRRRRPDPARALRRPGPCTSPSSPSAAGSSPWCSSRA